MCVAALLALSLAPAQDPGPVAEPLVHPGGEGPGRGKHVVLVAGDEEYRSEEALPMLARILAVHHGFRCTVLFSLDPETGEVDPMNQTSLPGLEALEGADLLVLFVRFRELPDEDMAHLVAYLERGGPVLGIRTSTHAFDYRRHPESPYAHYSWRSERWPGGFGRQILGETWVAHHGRHGEQSTRGVVEAASADHPILRGVEDVWGPTDVYAVRDLPADACVLLRGQVLAGMEATDPPAESEAGSPLMPILWTRELVGPGGEPLRAVCSTIGASQDLASAGLRRALVNACYWCVGLEDRIAERSVVDVVGEYRPSPFAHGGHRRGVKPSDLGLPAREPPVGEGDR